MKYHIPENTYPINDLYAVLSIDKNGNEGIVSMHSVNMAFPLVFGNIKLLEQLKESIKQMAFDTGQKLRICKFSRVEILEVIYEP